MDLYTLYQKKMNINVKAMDKYLIVLVQLLQLFFNSMYILFLEGFNGEIKCPSDLSLICNTCTNNCLDRGSFYFKITF